MKFLIKLAVVSALAEPAGAIIGLLTAGIFVNELCDVDILTSHL